MKTAAERKRDQRERARDAGLCLDNPAHGSAQPGKTMCADCQTAAYERVKARRYALKVTTATS